MGPGDPGLITVKALEILKSADVVFTAVSRGSDRSVSAAVVDAYPEIKGEKVELVFSMTTEKDIRAGMIKDNARRVMSELEKGRNCAFATIGDPLTYSTFGYLLKEIASPEQSVLVVPGVNAWSALAAESRTVLVEDLEKLSIVPSYKKMNQDEILDASDTVVFLKVYRQKDALLDQIEKAGGKVIYGSNLGLENEFISDDIEEIRKRDDEYLSMIISSGKA